MFVYCDTNVYCRPFDDQSQPRIKAETDAFLEILERVEKRKITLVSSDILTAEVRRISDLSKRRLVELYVAHCGKHLPANLEVVRIAQGLVKQCQLKPQDAFHIASACQGHVRFCLTCDDRVTKKHERIAKATEQSGFAVEVLTPIEFLSCPE